MLDRDGYKKCAGCGRCERSVCRCQEPKVVQRIKKVEGREFPFTICLNCLSVNYAPNDLREILMLERQRDARPATENCG